jgi:hypothetical protein
MPPGAPVSPTLVPVPSCPVRPLYVQVEERFSMTFGRNPDSL